MYFLRVKILLLYLMYRRFQLCVSHPPQSLTPGNCSAIGWQKAQRLWYVSWWKIFPGFKLKGFVGGTCIYHDVFWSLLSQHSCALQQNCLTVGTAEGGQPCRKRWRGKPQDASESSEREKKQRCFAWGVTGRDHQKKDHRDFWSQISESD